MLRWVVSGTCVGAFLVAACVPSLTRWQLALGAMLVLLWLACNVTVEILPRKKTPK